MCHCVDAPCPQVYNEIIYDLLDASRKAPDGRGAAAAHAGQGLEIKVCPFLVSLPPFPYLVHCDYRRIKCAEYM